MSTDLRFAHREVEAAKVLRDQIADLASGDKDFIRDTMEGETNLREMIAALVADDASDAALVEAAEGVVKKIKSRIDRIDARRETRRALIGSALTIAELKKLETPVGTVTVKAVAPKVVIIEEADIPASYFKPQPPKLDKKALGDALNAGTEVPGASLSNGSTTIQIRS